MFDVISAMRTRSFWYDAAAFTVAMVALLALYTIFA